MNEFEQFISSNYGIQPGDPVDDDTLRKASADFLQAKSAPAADLSGLTGAPKNVLEDFAGVTTPAPRPQALETPVPENTQTRLGLVNDSGMGAQSVLMEPTLVEGNPLVSFAAATPDEPAAEPQAQAQPPQQKAGRDWGSFHEIMPYRQSDLKLLAPEMETKNFNRDAREQAAQLRNRWNAEFDGDRQFFAGYGIYDLETADEVTRAPAELRMKAAQIIEQKIERGEVPDWVTTINSLREGGTSDSVDGSTKSSAGSTGSKAPDNTKLYEELELIESRIATNPTPDLMMRQDQLKQQITQVEGPKQYQNQLGFLDRKRNELRDLMGTPETLIASGYTNPITGTPIQSIEEAQDAQNRLLARRQKTLVEMRNAGEEYWGGLPSPQTFQYESTIDDATRDLNRLGIKNVSPRQHLSSMRRKEWTDFTSNQGEGFVYVDVGPGGRKNLVETTPVTPGPKKVKITEDNPFFTAAQAEGQSQAAMARGEKMKRLEGRRANLAEMDQEALRGSGNTGATWSTLAAGRMGSGAIPPVLSGESATAKAERYARLKQEVEDLERELSIVP
jgi:hypothetical protein